MRKGGKVYELEHLTTLLHDGRTHRLSQRGVLPARLVLLELELGAVGHDGAVSLGEVCLVPLEPAIRGRRAGEARRDETRLVAVVLVCFGQVLAGGLAEGDLQEQDTEFEEFVGGVGTQGAWWRGGGMSF